MISKIVSGVVLAVALSTVSVPVYAATTCKATMKEKACKKAGGTYDATAKSCTCPSK